MLLQNDKDVLLLFPYWKKVATFTRLQAKGAFIVSTEQNETIKNITILSEKGNICKLFNSFPEAQPKVYRFKDA